MRIESELKLGFEDVLIRPKRSSLSSRKQVNLERTFTFRNSGETWTGVPVMVANMDSTGTFEMAVEMSKHGVITCVHKHYTVDEWRAFLHSYEGSVEHIGLSIGICKGDIDKLDNIFEMDDRFKFICIDVANGYTESFIHVVQQIRERYPRKVIIAGNVVTAEMTEELILCGADIVKVGIGPGSVCTTRLKTGVGYPQLSAVIECADAAHGLKGHIVSDGGCVHPGDCSKAYGGGADFVMAGGMFAGHDESGGDVVEKDGQKFKLFYGMSSEHAMNKHGSGLKSYRSSEGKVVHTPYKGPVKDTLNDILGGIRSTCTYVGAASLRELSKRTTFIRTNKQVNTKYK
jgi:GMP reductase